LRHDGERVGIVIDVQNARPWTEVRRKRRNVACRHLFDINRWPHPLQSGGSPWWHVGAAILGIIGDDQYQRVVMVRMVVDLRYELELLSSPSGMLMTMAA